MEHREDRFQTTDQLHLYSQCWKPAYQPKAVIVLIHGSFEHSGRYRSAAEFFTGRGFAVHAFDLRGHGRSDGERAFINSFDILLKDVECFLGLVRQSEPGKPVFLLGHSAGGSIVLLSALARKASNIKGVIASAPILKISEAVSPFAQALTPVIAAFSPKAKLKQLNPQLLSRDPDVIASYLSDPFVYKDGVFAGALTQFLRAADRIYSGIQRLDIPFLILHGSADRICDIEGSKKLYSQSPSTDKTLNVYDNFYHEVLQEPGKERVWQDIAVWVDRRSQ